MGRVCGTAGKVDGRGKRAVGFDHQESTREFLDVLGMCV